jgi:cell division protein FtsL
MDATEYALRKVVHNKPIVREIDEVRQREMWQWVWMGLALVAVLLVSIWLNVGLLWQRGYGMETLQQQRAAEEETTRKLQLEIERLSSPKRIEEAATRLHMVPGLNDAIVIPRAIAPDRPPSSVVAAR